MPMSKATQQLILNLTDMINIDRVVEALSTFKGALPFDHCVVDGFFTDDFAREISQEFPDFDSPKWHCYKNAIEDKKTLNNWNEFGPQTYRAFCMLSDDQISRDLSNAVGTKLYPDPGLHGGGWHIHGVGGNLNPHLDYSIHPKFGKQRRINIIIYLSDNLDPVQHGGHLGFWSEDAQTQQPSDLITEIEPVFNRAVIFDTTQKSWHGMSRPFTPAAGVYRKSLAMYYMCEPALDADVRGRALFAPRSDQRGDESVLDLIKRRSNVGTSSQVYVVDDKKKGE
jgi:hypothetical protein